ncbi:MAG: S-methyl-5-thioribose-1-phosphate isomerase [Dehalococcoidia bacterium]|nr:S-methyl-5-thioribose-1-phosphate isomerase [Dehalococcoidia bacterium]
MEAIAWSEGKVVLLDQSRLPFEETYIEIEDHEAMAQAIRQMRVRGAPALGIAAAYGVALAARSAVSQGRAPLAAAEEAAAVLDSTRPTARNLRWAIERVLDAVRAAPDDAIPAAALAQARRIHEEEREANREIGRLGAALISDGAHVLTHCNAGALATAGYGTALGVLRTAWEQGKRLHVFVDETRPLLQGARLTAWELRQWRIPFTLIVDAAAGSLMRRGAVSCIVVGADRIAANGDVANKVGTYPLAVLAKENGVPFYVAAPSGTIDLALPQGDEIPIEERAPEEVTSVADRRIAPEGVEAFNPAFDVTPHRYVSAIITERGIVREPYDEGLARLLAVRAATKG